MRVLQKLTFANNYCIIEQSPPYLMRVLQNVTFANNCCIIEQSSTYLMRVLQKLTFPNNCCIIEQSTTYLKKVLLLKLTFVYYCRKRPLRHGTPKQTIVSPHSLTTPCFCRDYSSPHPHAPLLLRPTITFSSQLRLGLRSGFCFLSATHIFLIAMFSTCLLPLPHKHSVASYRCTMYVVCMLSL